MLYELTHVQEAMQQLEKHSADPFMLQPASEQVCFMTKLIELCVKVKSNPFTKLLYERRMLSLLYINFI